MKGAPIPHTVTMASRKVTPSDQSGGRMRNVAGCKRVLLDGGSETSLSSRGMARWFSLACIKGMRDRPRIINKTAHTEITVERNAR